MAKKAKIVATLGPASQDEQVLIRMIEAGMDIARLNFSHGTQESHGKTITLLRRLSEQLGKPVTILQDLQGPKLRVGLLPAGGVQLTAGQRVLLTEVNEDDNSFLPGGEHLVIPLSVPALARSVKPGNHIMMDDGHLELEVLGVEGSTVEAKVLLGGKLTSNKGVNMPYANLGIPGFTSKDRADLAFGLQAGVDAVAVSFVRTAKDIDTIRAAMQELSPDHADTPLIAKLELPEAIDNLEEIIAASDGVMVARGDLAVETSPARVPVVQKMMIDPANRGNRVVITATQMLESMIHNPRPTRAEASDVANAILDGTDAVMLSAESAVGQYPVESIAMMSRIVEEAEQYYGEWGRKSANQTALTGEDVITTTRAAWEMSQDPNVSRVVVFTMSGKTALYMSKTRPPVPIMALTPDQRTYQRLGLYWGVTPYKVPFADDMESMIRNVDSTVGGTSTLRSGSQMVLVASFPVGSGALPNFALLHTVGKDGKAKFDPGGETG
jgi:pyruvate kinase